MLPIHSTSLPPLCVHTSILYACFSILALQICSSVPFFTSFYLFILFLAVLGLHCYVGFSLVAASGGYSLAAVHRFLIAVASPVVEHGL